MLYLYSGIDIVRGYILIALSSLLDKEKINKEEQSLNICSSVLYLILSNVKEWGLLNGIKFNVNQRVKDKEIF